MGLFELSDIQTIGREKEGFGGRTSENGARKPKKINKKRESPSCSSFPFRMERIGWNEMVQAFQIFNGVMGTE